MNSSIIVASISACASFIAIYLSAMRDKYALKQEIRRERLNNFYIPFYQMYCRGFLSINNLSTMGFESRGKFLDLMSKNIVFMGQKSQALYPEYYKAFLDMLEADNGNPDYPLDICQKNFDNIFDKLSKEVFIEYRRILKKSCLPVPSIKSR